MKNEWYIWFPDSHLETISIRCLFLTRLLNYSKVDYNINYIKLPNQLSDLNIEAKEIPVLKCGEDTFTSHKIIDLCKKSAKENERELIGEDRSLGSRILFQWATTNLLGIYVGLLYGDKAIRQRVYSDYLKTYPEFSEKNLNLVSKTMLEWTQHNKDISINPVDQKEQVIEILNGFDEHLKNSQFWFGDQLSTCDFALFAFVYMMYNSQMIYFHDLIKKKENLFNWLKKIDQLSRSEYSRLKV
jgi:hypothetical protein